MEGLNAGVVGSPTVSAEPAGSSTVVVRFPPVQLPHSLVVDKGTSRQAQARRKGCFTGKSTLLKDSVIYLKGDEVHSRLTAQVRLPWRGPYALHDVC